ncbi:MAG: hypothetical protein NTY35_16410 [Planctomycetota bacterium]|nr:hypothetical protein [Planctomycetota bacterium]
MTRDDDTAKETVARMVGETSKVAVRVTWDADALGGKVLQKAGPWVCSIMGDTLKFTGKVVERTFGSDKKK